MSATHPNDRIYTGSVKPVDRESSLGKVKGVLATHEVKLLSGQLESSIIATIDLGTRMKQTRCCLVPINGDPAQEIPVGNRLTVGPAIVEKQVAKQKVFEAAHLYYVVLLEGISADLLSIASLSLKHDENSIGPRSLKIVGYVASFLRCDDFKTFRANKAGTLFGQIGNMKGYCHISENVQLKSVFDSLQ